MAWLVSVKLHSFPVPSRCLPTQRGAHPKMPAQYVVSNLRPKRVVNILLSACTSKQTTALSHDRYHVALAAMGMHQTMYDVSSTGFFHALSIQSREGTLDALNS
uniref:Uncharacterized protein n=1 Tax=Opuntia streptacantha TaxID=393608 RepID=A0A7C8YXH0_OPUST